MSTGRLQKLIIFDHFEAFNNIANNPSTSIETEIHAIDRGFLVSEYAMSLLRYTDKADLEAELAHTFEMIASIDIDLVLNSLNETFPESWDVYSKSINYIKDFLTNQERLKNLKESLDSYIHYYI